MHLLVLVALAPLRQVSFAEPQRGDQGGLRTHNTVHPHPGMKQDATFVEEISQGAGIQFLQPTARVTRAEMQSGATVHAPLKAVQQATELAVSSADLSRPGKNNSVVHKPEPSAPETVSSLSHRNSLVLLKHEGGDRSVTTADVHKTFNVARETCPFVFLVICSAHFAALLRWLRHCLKRKGPTKGAGGSIFAGTKPGSTLSVSQAGVTRRWPTRGSLFCL